MRGLGIVPKIVVMRGDTDGSASSAGGPSTPIVSMGDLDFHSRLVSLPTSAFRGRRPRHKSTIRLGTEAPA